MFKRIAVLTISALLTSIMAPATGQAQSGTKAGMLACQVAPSIGFIIAGRQSMTCRFTPDGPYAPEIYSGSLTTVGLDIGITAGGAMAWAVIAPTAGPPRGGLAGVYVGASGEIGVGVGAGANVLVGGSGRSFALQPVSVSGEVGVNLALGAASLELLFVR